MMKIHDTFPWSRGEGSHTKTQKRKRKKYEYESEDLDENGGQARGIDVSSHRDKVTQGLGVACAQIVRNVEELERFFWTTGLDRIIVYRSSEPPRSKHYPSDLNMWYPRDLLGEDISTARLDGFVCPDMEIPTIDVMTQEEGPMFSIRDIQRYFSTPVEKRDRMLNIVSFNLGLTDLCGFVVPPSIVRELDLVRRVWPRQGMSRFQREDVWNPFAFLHEGDDDGDVYAAPETMTYLLLGPAGAYTDWHVDMGGSSVWYHVVKGQKVFMAAPNTEKNIQAFLEWSSSEEQVTFLGERLEGCVRAVLMPGDTLFLPGGWLHAVSTPQDSIVLGGNYINPLQLGKSLQVIDIEKALRVGKDATYPKYDMLMYYAACDFISRVEGCKGVLKSKTMLSSHEEKGLPYLVQYFENLVGTLVKRAERKRKDAEVFKAHVDACVEKMDMVIRMLKKSINYLASIKPRIKQEPSPELGVFHQDTTSSHMFGGTFHNIQSVDKKSIQ